MGEHLLRWFGESRLRLGVASVLLVSLVIGILDLAYVTQVLDQVMSPRVFQLVEGVIVELHGAWFDVLLFGVVLLWFDERRPGWSRITDWEQRLTRLCGSDGEEVSAETESLIRRIAAAGERVKAPEACLRSADLQRLQLDGASLAAADLREANLAEASFVRADLRGTKFGGANLKGACLVGADLRGSDLTNADVRNADLRGATIPVLTQDLQNDASLLPWAVLSIEQSADIQRRLDAITKVEDANFAGALRRIQDPPIPGWVLRVDGRLTRDVAPDDDE